ncbi:EAL domain-containing protein [Paracoccus sphaerophysae]|uniref:EAL domain-containing protein n=1 Tax=Paracoccus sphaerophysae TaxID=690417 RepID=UPI000A847AEF|nr:EAL domain-containing protein [Paracoccus sphaerophysae]
MRRVISAFRRSQRVAVVVQVDNLALLTRCIGLSQTAALLSALCARIGVVLDVPTPAALGPRGQIAVLLDVSGQTAALRKALQVQSVAQAGFDLPHHAPGPGISAVLVRGEGAVSDDRLVEQGRLHLARLGPGFGAVSMISVSGQPADGAAVAPEPALIEPDLFEPFFQPQLCCHSGTVTGFEILARARHPLRGLLGPAAFLPLLPVHRQRTLTRAMLSQGIAALIRWRAEGFDVATVSLNVAAADLVEPDFADFVLWELDRQDVPPTRLVIEVMEDVSPLDMPDTVRANLVRLSGLGCRIDLDDFGTGYASFEALRRLPAHRVKIDRSFVTGCDRDENQQRLILAILALADRMGLETVAEGVETAAEHAFVAQIGCSHAQGYAIARPMPLAETFGFLAGRAATARELPVLSRRAG